MKHDSDITNKKQRKKLNRKRRRILKMKKRRKALQKQDAGKWFLVKKDNGDCACYRKPRGNTVIGKYNSFRECEDHRSHDC